MVRAIKLFMMATGQVGPSGSDGSCGPYGPGDQASQGGPGDQVIRWSGGKSGQGGHPGCFHMLFRCFQYMVFMP